MNTTWDPRWRALAEGKLSLEELTNLRQEAELTEEGRALWELYRPSTPEETERVVRVVLTAMDDNERRRRRRRATAAAVVLIVVAAVLIRRL